VTHSDEWIANQFVLRLVVRELGKFRDRLVSNDLGGPIRCNECDGRGSKWVQSYGNTAIAHCLKCNGSGKI
jgi:hypothetical protein